MKKIISSIILLFCVYVGVNAESIVLDYLRFDVKSGGNSVSVKAADAKKLINVEIPSQVKIDGRNYHVTEIAKGGFKNCKKLKSIVIPNTVEKIGEEAFWNCPVLESVVMPDKCTAKLNPGSYGFGKYGIFKDCKSLTRLRGTTIMYPQYILFDALYDCKEVPAYDILAAVDASEIDKQGLLNTKFSEFMKANFLPDVEKWQRRNSYETVAQWEARVNDENRRSMINEAVAEGRSQFIKNFAPFAVKGSLEDYDSQNGIFPIYLGELGTVYAVVPANEANAFKDNWKDVKVTPEYGIIDNAIGVKSCSFSYADKTYKSPNSYVEDNLDEIAMLVTPLASLREYEAQLASNEEKSKDKKQYAPDVVDINIPSTDAKRDRTFAVIIGNENYQRVAKVDFAQNDARVLAKYFTRTLGIPETNVRTYYDATYGDIVAALEDMKSVAEAYKGDIDVIFYYAGHGLPDESSRNAYILPIDANGTSTEVCYPVEKLYDILGSLKTRQTVAILDACFSGSLRGDGMLASARGIRLRPKESMPSGNLVAFSAASGDQTAYPYDEKNHGLFSYYLIKKLNENNGDVTLGELSEYLIDNVSQQSVTVNHKPQRPTVKCSSEVADSWKKLKF